MGKLWLALCFMLTSLQISAHQFWPDDYNVVAIPGRSTVIVTHLKSNEGGMYKFTVNNKTIADKQPVLPGETAVFPIEISSKFLYQNEYVTLCTIDESGQAILASEVCLKLKIE